jgi:hypothetical protein
MPYHSLGIGKAEKIGTSALFFQRNANDEDISRWTSFFNEHGIDIKVSK